MDYAAALDGPAWLRKSRIRAAETFATMALPTSALEDWRYSRIDSLDIERFWPAGRPGSVGLQAGFRHALPKVQAGPTGALIAAAASYAESIVTVETIDGAVSSVGGDPSGAVTLSIVSRGSPESRAGHIDDDDDHDDDDDAFVVANRAFSVDPILVEVAPGRTGATVLVVHRCDSDGVVSFPRLSVDAGPQSQVTVIEVVAGDGACLVVPATRLEVAPSAEVVYLGLQMLGGSAWQIASQASRVAAGGSLTSGAIALGGDYARLRTASRLEGARASSRLVAMYFASGSQMHDFRTVQDHRAARTASDLLYKGVVANTARSVYSGLIRVAKGAKATTAYQANRNLVLHEGARAESVPNLEIDESDVTCSHASAIGPVAEDEQFYLHSRGVPAQVADRLISVGFLAEVIDQLPLGPIGAQVTSTLAAKLAEADSIEAQRVAAVEAPDRRGEAGL